MHQIFDKLFCPVVLDDNRYIVAKEPMVLVALCREPIEGAFYQDHPVDCYCLVVNSISFDHDATRLFDRPAAAL